MSKKGEGYADTSKCDSFSLLVHFFFPHPLLRDIHSQMRLSDFQKGGYADTSDSDASHQSREASPVRHGVAVCCSVLQCVAVFC